MQAHRCVSGIPHPWGDIGSRHCHAHTSMRCDLLENGTDMDNSGGAYTVATPAAAAMRSTLRRLREIAEV